MRVRYKFENAFRKVFAKSFYAKCSSCILKKSMISNICFQLLWLFSYKTKIVSHKQRRKAKSYYYYTVANDFMQKK